MFAQYFILIVLSTFTVTLANDDPSPQGSCGHILKNNNQYEFVTVPASAYKEPSNALATGCWNQTYNSTGWSVLEIKTFDNHSNVDQVYAAGLLEGQLTRELIDLQWENSIRDICVSQTEICERLRTFLTIQLDWIYDQINSYPNEEYWHQIKLLLVQLNGLIDGYANTSRTPRQELDDPMGFFLFQIVESTGDLLTRLGMDGVERHDSCSALIKIVGNNEDIFVSHADWSNYKTMLKVIKRYMMPLKRSAVAASPAISAHDTVFSSYPGTLHSIDDFYMTRPANLTIIETTIVNNNTDLNHNIIPISVPEWMRIVVANRLANSGQEWIDKFFLFNDGTYNNQWMISDFKKFTPGKAPEAGFLMVAEQMVTEHLYEDMTQRLINDTYWASYNNVYFPYFRNISHEDEMVAEKGPELYSWAHSSRARIFRRDHVNVTDLNTMMKMMRYNDFKNDFLSQCPGCIPHNYSAELTIAARCDLNDPNGTYPEPALGYRIHGATDAKITSHALMQNFTLSAIAGPTTEGQPPFVWSNSSFDKTVPHFGHPDVWNFTEFRPTWVF